MSAEEIRVRAQDVQSRVRRNLLIAFAVGLLLLLSSTAVIVLVRSTHLRMIAAGMMGVTLAIAYQAYTRIWLRRATPADAAGAGCLDFYRKELKAEYRSLQLTWRLIVPIVAFLFLIWSAVLRLDPLIARIALPAVLIFIIFARRRNKRNLKQKLIALDAFEREES